MHIDILGEDIIYLEISIVLLRIIRYGMIKKIDEL